MYRKNKDLVERAIEEFESSDWDLTQDSLERIAKKLKPEFGGSFDEALEFVQGLANSMFGGEIEGSGRI
jgi:hypothetical protein